DRRRATTDLVRSLTSGTTTLAGGGADGFEALVASDPARSDRLLASLAERYHLGTLNDCHFRPEHARCGTDGPHLAERHCTTTSCTNAVVTERHIPAWRNHLASLDDQL